MQDRELRYTYVVNPQLGLAEEDMLGKTDYEFLKEEDAKKLTSIKRSVIDTGEPTILEDSFVDVAGNPQYFEGSYIPTFDEKNQVSGLIGYFKNVTDRKLQQMALERMRIILSEGQRIAHVGSFEYIAETQTTVWSEEEYLIYGLDPARPAPAYDVMLANNIHPNDADLLHRTFMAAMQSRSMYDLEHRIVRPDGSVRWVYDRAQPYFDEQGKLVKYIGATLDTTERKQAEASLHKAYAEMESKVAERTRELREKDQILIMQGRQAAMGEMISNIAHQWRQPLNALGLAIQQLPLLYDTGRLEREILENTVKTSMVIIKHMSSTIEDFRNYFKPDKERADFSLKDAVAKTLSLVKDSFENNRIRIEVVENGDPIVHGYQNELSQALLNILNNARDALIERETDNPYVTISILGENSKRELIVTDNAGGIPGDIIEKIFDPYFTTKGPQQGTGVGLFMSKAIIEKNMGGRLSARNTADGAEFRITL